MAAFLLFTFEITFIKVNCVSPPKNFTTMVNQCQEQKYKKLYKMRCPELYNLSIDKILMLCYTTIRKRKEPLTVHIRHNCLERLSYRAYGEKEGIQNVHEYYVLHCLGSYCFISLANSISFLSNCKTENSCLSMCIGCYLWGYCFVVHI